MKPLLRWVGGKYNQTEVTNRLHELYLPYRNAYTWVEPFCGGLGATHAIAPKVAILGDSNEHLIRFYHSIKDGNGWDEEYLTFWADSETAYDKVRELLNKELYSPGTFNRRDFATIFYLVNRTCFNGLWRVNASGLFNVPQGKTSKGIPLKPSLPDHVPYRDRFARWKFRSCAWQSLLADRFDDPDWFPLPDHSFLYIDPPYDGTYTQYTPNQFSWRNQQVLAHQLSWLKHPIVVSNAATDRIIQMYQGYGFKIELLNAKRSVSCNGDRKQVQEMLATKNL
jgi:DNA adenine methylase